MLKQSYTGIHSLEKAMAELDHPGHMPEGLDEHVWQRLVQARRMKVESEQKVCIMLNCYVQIVDVLLNISLH